MKKFYISLIFITCILLNASGENNYQDNGIVSKISSDNIKIGEKILLQIKIQNMKKVKVLWEEMNATSNDVEISSKKDEISNNCLNLEIEFTFFESGVYKDFSFTIPISTSDGKILYLTSDKYQISVKNPLTDEEIKNIKNTKDPTKIKLKKEKNQANMPFVFSFYLIILLIITVLFFIGAFLYFFIYKKMMKERKNPEKNKLPPYEEFLAEMVKINFDRDDERKIVEKKLSGLTEILKKLIYNEFSLNAPSETTYELTLTLRKKKFENDLIAKISKTFNEIDMIKFAKAEADYDRIMDYVRIIGDMGKDIHFYSISLSEKENFDNFKGKNN